MDILSLVISTLIGLFAGVFIDTRMRATFREDVRRAEQLVRRMRAEHVVDNPRVLSQPLVPEQVMRLMTSQEIGEVLQRPRIDEVVVLPEIRKPNP